MNNLLWVGFPYYICITNNEYLGNGIQHILEDRDDVMYVSLHRFTKYFYPGTGSIEEVGHGTGRGSTVNIPWECTGLNDADYLAAFDLIIEPIVKQFAPDIIIVSAGFDAVDGDPLGGMCVTPEGNQLQLPRIPVFYLKACVNSNRIIVNQ